MRARLMISANICPANTGSADIRCCHDADFTLFGLHRHEPALLVKVLKRAAKGMDVGHLASTCSLFCTHLYSAASSLTLSDAVPSAAHLERLRQAGIKKLDISKCTAEWPLTHLVASLPGKQLESITMARITEADVQRIPTHLTVHIKEVNAQDMHIALRVLNRLDGDGGVEIDKLVPSRQEANLDLLANSSPRLPKIFRASPSLVPPLRWCAELTKLEGVAELADMVNIVQLPKLRELQLDCALNELPANMSMLCTLTKLSWTTFGDASFPDVLWSLNGLRDLVVTEDVESLPLLPDHISRLSALTRLRADVSNIPQSISKVSNLVHLAILTCDPNELTFLSGLWQLRLLAVTVDKGLDACNFPPFLSTFTNLERLSLDGLGARDRLPPDAFSALINLQQLLLMKCDAAPASLWGLPRLRTLHLVGSVSPLPPANSCLPQLTALVLKCLDVSGLARIFGTCLQLKTLILDTCQHLSLLPSLSRHTQLTMLSFRGCTSLRTLPSACMPPNLELCRLNMCGNLHEDSLAALAALPFLDLEAALKSRDCAPSSWCDDDGFYWPELQ